MIEDYRRLAVLRSRRRSARRWIVIDRDRQTAESLESSLLHALSSSARHYCGIRAHARRVQLAICPIAAPLLLPTTLITANPPLLSQFLALFLGRSPRPLTTLAKTNTVVRRL